MTIDRDAAGQVVVGALITGASLAVGNPMVAAIAQGAGVNIATDALPALWRGLRGPAPGTALAVAYGNAFREAVAALEARYARDDVAFALLSQSVSVLGQGAALPAPTAEAAQEALDDALPQLLYGHDAGAVRFIRENLLVEVQRTFHIEMERNATARQLFTMMLSERIAQELVQLRLSQDELTRLLNGLGSMPAQLAAIQRSLAALERERNSSSVAAVPLVGAIDSEGDENENTIENEGEPPSVVTQRGSFGSIHSRGNRNRNRVINRRTPAPSADDRTTILALFADPLPRNKPLDLMREQRQLQRGLAEFPDAFRLEVVASATIDDLTRQLLALQPTVIHLGGHGSVTGFYFSDEAGNRCMIQWAHLSEELRAHSPPLQVVVLSACYGLEGLGQLDVPWLVAMPGPLYDEASIAFARGFYQSLNANSGAIRAAYDAGRRAAHRAGFVDAELPQLFADGELL